MQEGRREGRAGEAHPTRVLSWPLGVEACGAAAGACPPGFSGRVQWKFLTQRIPEEGSRRQGLSRLLNQVLPNKMLPFAEFRLVLQQLPKETGKVATLGTCAKAAQGKERGMVSFPTREVVERGYRNGPWQVRS